MPGFSKVDNVAPLEAISKIGALFYYLRLGGVYGNEFRKLCHILMDFRCILYVY